MPPLRQMVHLFLSGSLRKALHSRRRQGREPSQGIVAMKERTNEADNACPGGAGQSLKRGVAVATVVVLCVSLVLMAGRFVLLAALPYNVVYPENSMAEGIWRAASGKPVYEDWRQWPHRGRRRLFTVVVRWRWRC